MIRWSACGERMPTTRSHEFNLIPTHEFKVDDKVLVRNYEDEPWNVRFFAGYDQLDERMFAYYQKGKITSWRYCIHYDPSIPTVA